MGHNLVTCSLAIMKPSHKKKKKNTTVVFVLKISISRCQKINKEVAFEYWFDTTALVTWHSLHDVTHLFFSSEILDFVA